MSDKKNLGGAPTKYNESMLDIASDYSCNFEDYGDIVPSVVGLALALGVATNTVYNWSKDPEKPEFLRIFTRIEQIQHQKLVNGGLSSSFNPAITKMMLTKHGYSDKIEQDVKSSDGSMTPTPRTITLVAPSMAPKDQ